MSLNKSKSKKIINISREGQDEQNNNNISDSNNSKQTMGGESSNNNQNINNFNNNNQNFLNINNNNNNNVKHRQHNIIHDNIDGEDTQVIQNQILVQTVNNNQNDQHNLNIINTNNENSGLFNQHDGCKKLSNQSNDHTTNSDRVGRISLKTKKFVSKRDCDIQDIYEDILNEQNQRICLGRGGFGVVKLVRNIKTHEKRAIKMINKSQMGPQDRQNLTKEIDIMKDLSHVNILKIYEYYEDQDNLYIVTEYCSGGNLFDQIISKGKKFNEKQASLMMRQVIGAIKYAHSKEIVHRDIKPENILIDYIDDTPQTTQQSQIINNTNQDENSEENRSFIIKLIDWGLSTFQVQDQKLTQKCGTYYYMAPEVLLKEYDEKADIWSSGVLLYVLISGILPFDGQNSTEIIQSIKSGKFSLTKYDCLKKLSPLVKDLLKKMLRKDINKRFSAEQVLDHPWFELGQTESQENISESQLKQSFGRLQKYNSNPNQKIQQIVLQYIASHGIGKKERNNLMQIFSKLDKNQDGKLTRQELFQGYKSIYQNEQECQSAVDSIISKIDVDEDGYINIDEFIAATMKVANILNEHNMHDAFNLFDRNQDGIITLQEIKNIVGGEMSGDQNEQQAWQQAFDEVDSNGDGQISLEEFKQLLSSFAKESATISQEQDL